MIFSSVSWWFVVLLLQGTPPVTDPGFRYAQIQGIEADAEFIAKMDIF